MVQFEWWWVWLLLPLPWLSRWLPAARNHSQFLLTVPLLQQPEAEQLLRHNANRRKLVMLVCIWILVISALARPYWIGDPTHRAVSGRDLMIAIDVSGSMYEADMFVDNGFQRRIDVLKTVIGRFVEQRPGDRLGLILFGTHAYPYVPLTFDHDMLGSLLSDVSTGLAGRLTAIGDAIAVAVGTFSQQDSRHKVLILVTDGSNTAGSNDPLAAAQIASRFDMTIYTVGIGNDAETLKKLTNQSSVPPEILLNEKLLRQIAALTGGRYFRAQDAETLEKIYAELDRLEPIDLKAGEYRPEVSLFHYPVALATLLLLLYLLQHWFGALTVKSRQRNPAS